MQGRHFDWDAIFVATAGSHQFKTLGSAAPLAEGLAGKALAEVSGKAKAVQHAVETAGKFVTAGAKKRVQS